MHNSILADVKKICQVPEWDDGFDTELIIHINTALMTLGQLGIGPPGGLVITNGEDTWASLVEGDDEIEGVKTYVGLKVKMIFDSSNMTSYVLESYKNITSELEYRLNSHAEGDFND